MTTTTQPARLRAYLAYSSLKLTDLAAMSQSQLGAVLTFTGANMTGDDNWLEVGAADVSITLHRDDKIVSAAVENLRTKQRKLRADAEMEVTRLERTIQKMLAITCEGATV